MRRLATLLLVVALVTGCGQSKEDEQRNAAEAARVAEALEKVPGVREADVLHLVDPSTPGVARVTLVVDPQTPTRTAEQAVVEALWLSRLDPLAGFLLDVQDPDGSYRTGIEDVRFSDLQDDLRRRYGPRPVPDR